MNSVSTLFGEHRMMYSDAMSLKLIRIARLKQFAHQRQASGPGELGALIGRKINQVSDLLAGRAAFGEKVARSIEEVAGLEVGWLDSEEGVTARHLASESVAPPYHIDAPSVKVPVLAVAASMGAGLQQHDDVIVGQLTLSPNWISKVLQPLTGAENLRFIHGYGDSMHPTFSDGDMLLIDGGIRDVKIDGIYVLEASQRLFIKRVRQKLDGTFEISSDNPTVKTVDVLSGDHAVTVLGRVVWVWNGRKM